MNKIDRITQIVGQKFRSFGGGHVTPCNPVSEALKNQPLQFAAGVDIKAVVQTVLGETQAQNTPAESKYGRQLGAVKPLAQYLDKYIKHEVELGNIPPEVAKLYAYDAWQQLLEQAFDAYESTEQVKVRIERV